MPQKKLADRLRDAIRLRGYSIRTEKACVHDIQKLMGHADIHTTLP